MTRIAVVALVLGLGCSAGDLDAAQPPFAGGEEPNEPEQPDPTDGPPGVDDAAAPTFQAMLVTLPVDDLGTVDLETASASWWLADAAASELCRTELTVVAALPEVLDSGEKELLGAWELETAAETDGFSCSAPAPTAFSVAIGLPDPRLASAVERDDALAGRELYQYAIRLEGSGPRIVHGVATTPSLLDGDADAALTTIPPLPADVYTLEPLLYLNHP